MGAKGVAGIRSAEPTLHALDAAGVGAAPLDDAGRLLGANAALEALACLPAPALAGRPLPDLVSEDHREAATAALREVLEGRSARASVEVRLARAGGAPPPCRVTVAAVPGAGILALVEDRSAARAAREEHARAIHALGERVKELGALHAAASFLHEDALPAAGMLARVAALLPPAFQFPADAAARVVLGPESHATPGFTITPWLLAAPFRTADGETGAVEVAYLRDPAPGPGGPFLEEERRLLASLAEMIASALDRRRADARLRAVVDTDAVRVWEWDLASGRISWPGLRAKEEDGAPRDLTLTFDDAMEAVHPDERAAVRQGLLVAVSDPARGGRFAAEYRIALPGRAYGWRHTTGQVLRDAAGRPARMVGLSTDISEERALEERLRQGEKMEALGRLAGGVAHDFNNILVAILGYAQLASIRLPEGEPARRYVDEIARAGESAAALVRQILAFGRRQALRPRPVDLRGAVGEMESMIVRLLGSRIEVRCDFEGESPVAVVDPHQFQQVVLNLSVNARDAMPDGGTLTIRARKRRGAAPLENGSSGPERDWAALEVEDTGVGIPPELRSRIFEPFFTTKGEGKGTGLGLATVYGIVSQSGGFLEVESEVGRGSLFRAQFPVPA